MKQRTKLRADSRGAYGVLLGVCVAFAALGLVLDFVSNSRGSFWILGLPGGRALIGAGAAAFAIGAAWVTRLLLARPMEHHPHPEARDAGDHA